MSFLKVDDVTDVMETGLEPDALQDVIDREEDWLANDIRIGIGPLTGSRTQETWRPRGGSGPIRLRRPTAEVRVVDGGVHRTDYHLLAHLRVEPGNGRWAGPTIEITYTPNDGLRVKRVLLELVRLTLSATPYKQETTDGHTYTAMEIEGAKDRLARSLSPTSIGFAGIRIRPRNETLVTGPRIGS